MKFRLSTYVIPLKAYSAVLITPPPPPSTMADFMIPPLLSQLPQKSGTVLSFGRSGQLQVLRNDSALPEKEPWEQFLLPNPHTDRLKFYNGAARQISICFL